MVYKGQFTGTCKSFACPSILTSTLRIAPMNAAGILINKAADEINKRGHAQDTFVRPDGSICALMALNLAAGGTIDGRGRMGEFEVSEARHIIEKAVGTDICYWNNQGDNIRNKEGVVARLREIAKTT